VVAVKFGLVKSKRTLKSAPLNTIEPTKKLSEPNTSAAHINDKNLYHNQSSPASATFVGNKMVPDNETDLLKNFHSPVSKLTIAANADHKRLDVTTPTVINSVNMSVSKPTIAAKGNFDYQTASVLLKKVRKPTNSSISRVTIAAKGNSDCHTPSVLLKTIRDPNNSLISKPTIAAQSNFDYQTSSVLLKKVRKPTNSSISRVTIAAKGNSDYHTPSVPSKTARESTNTLSRVQPANPTLN